MTATEAVRRMLDERGVEWVGTDFTEPTSGHATNTSLDHDHHDAVFTEYVDGTVLRLFDLTPEQAIAATLGRGECHVKAVRKLGDSFGFKLSCGHSMVNPFDDRPDYCPWCGRKVVGE